MIKFDFPIKQAHQAGREEQQDAVDCFYTEDKQRFLLVVADGMGGHKGGRLASAAVLETASEVWMESLQGMPNDPQAVLQDLCERAHKRINQVGKMHDLSPRSTVVLLYVDKDYAWWAHVGDSRLYHFRHEKLLFRTKDHSVVQMLVGLEQISEAEMANHPDQGRLLRWLGGEQFKGAEFGESALIPGDCFVLCSDGLWEYVDTDKMVYFLRHEVLDKSAGALLGLALKASQGEGDNISLALLRSQASRSFSRHWRWLLIIALFLAVIGMGIVWWAFLPQVQENSLAEHIEEHPSSQAQPFKIPHSIPHSGN